jgi:hypothetical protein
MVIPSHVKVTSGCMVNIILAIFSKLFSAGTFIVIEQEQDIFEAPDRQISVCPATLSVLSTAVCCYPGIVSMQYV